MEDPRVIAGEKWVFTALSGQTTPFIASLDENTVNVGFCLENTAQKNCFRRIVADPCGQTSGKPLYLAQFVRIQPISGKGDIKRNIPLNYLITHSNGQNRRDLSIKRVLNGLRGVCSIISIFSSINLAQNIPNLPSIFFLTPRLPFSFFSHSRFHLDGPVHGLRKLKQAPFRPWMRYQRFGTGGSSWKN